MKAFSQSTRQAFDGGDLMRRVIDRASIRHRARADDANVVTSL